MSESEEFGRGVAAGRRRGSVVGAIAVVTVVFTLGVLTLPAGGFAIRLWSDAAWTLASLGAALKCFHTARRRVERHHRRAWTWFGLGCLAWFGGMLLWDVNELVRGIVTPFPSVADVGFLAIVPCFVAGCYYYKAEQPGMTLSFKQAGDLGVVASVLVLAAALIVYGPAAHFGDDPVYVTVALGYAVLHPSALLFGLVCLWQHVWGRNRWVLGLHLAGMAMLAVVTMLYANSLLGRRYETGHILDVGWIVCFGLILWAAFEEDWLVEADAAPARGVSRLDALVPSAAVGVVAISVGLFRDQWAPQLWPVFVVGGVALGVFLGLRAWATQRLERELRDDLHARDLHARRLEVELVRAQKLEAVGALAGGIAHELKNLIAGMTMGVSMIRSKQARGDDATEIVDTVEHCVERAADMTSRLLTLSRRREPQAQAPAPTVADPGEIVGRMATLMQKVMPRGLSVEMAGMSNLPAVSVDVGLFEQALLNLALNARDAMRGQDDGVLRFAIAVTERVAGGDEAHPGHWVSVSVSDTGAGIEPALVSRIFEPFFTTKPPGEGTGFGLAMVDAFARDHGGWVEVESELGHGATFRIHLPALARTAAAAARVDEELPAGEATVLVVGDVDSLALPARGILERCGYTVELAAGGSEALSALDKGGDKIALVITDGALAEMGGVQLLRAMRARGHAQPLILATTYDADLQSRSRELAAVVRKPFDPKALAVTVKDVLGGAQRSLGLRKL